MSNNLAEKTSVLRASARAAGPSNSRLELAHQVSDRYLLVYLMLSRRISLGVVGPIEKHIPSAAKAGGDKRDLSPR